MKKTEQRTADTILQREKTITIAGTEYTACAPTPATLIMVSELVADLPPIESNGLTILRETLRTARDCKVIGKIAATLILGAKRIKENRQVEVGRKRAHWYSWRRDVPVTESELDHLAETILEELTMEQIRSLLQERLGDMQVADFFAVTTFLRAASITRPTREPEATASGQ
ncbi:MAG: hypothetical protein MJZ26_09130 [Fibrobacter sp.]|nr:hypothetical protein [Fibrobacter sp.]